MTAKQRKQAAEAKSFFKGVGIGLGKVGTFAADLAIGPKAMADFEAGNWRKGLEAGAEMLAIQIAIQLVVMGVGALTSGIGSAPVEAALESAAMGTRLATESATTAAEASQAAAEAADAGGAKAVSGISTKTESEAAAVEGGEAAQGLRGVDTGVKWRVVGEGTDPVKPKGNQRVSFLGEEHPESQTRAKHGFKWGTEQKELQKAKVGISDRTDQSAEKTRLKGRLEDQKIPKKTVKSGNSEISSRRLYKTVDIYSSNIEYYTEYEGETYVKVQVKIDKIEDQIYFKASKNPYGESTIWKYVESLGEKPQPVNSGSSFGKYIISLQDQIADLF